MVVSLLDVLSERIASPNFGLFLSLKDSRCTGLPQTAPLLAPLPYVLCGNHQRRPPHENRRPRRKPRGAGRGSANVVDTEMGRRGG